MVSVCVVLIAAVVATALAAPQTLTSAASVDHQGLAYPEVERNIKIRNKQVRL